MNKTETNNTKNILKELCDSGSREEQKMKLEFDICDHYGKQFNDMDAREIDDLVERVHDHIRLKPLVHKTAEAVAAAVLFNPQDTRWLADKAVDVLTTAVGVGGLVWAGQKMGLLGTTGMGHIPGASYAGSSPFSDTTVAATPRPKRNNVVPFDKRAS